MEFLSKIFGSTEKPVKTYDDFWNWFVANEQKFFEVVKRGTNLEADFFDELSQKLAEIKDGFFYLAGMLTDNTAELVFTADGDIKNIVFVEELVNAAPPILNWKFTALKPPTDIENFGISMADYNFDNENLSFYTIEHENYPDEVDIVVAHCDFNEEDKTTIINGVYIFLDNYLGELTVVSSIDSVTVISKEQAENELIPISKLKDYLILRQKGFQEKYSGTRYDTESDSYSAFEGELNNGRPIVGIINSSLLEWDSKASHPWILKIDVSFDGDENYGMPNEETFELLDEFENEIMFELKDFDGYLNIGRETADNKREIYFACKDFRKPSKVLNNFANKYIGKVDFVFDIYRDKYWQSFKRFRSE